MPSSRLRSPTVRAVGVAVALAALVATGAIVGGVLADDHTRDQAPHYGPDEAGNATFEFVEQADHHPGAENVSVRYTLKGGAIYDDVGASDGVAADRFVVETDAVDHSDCATDNVAAFGVDRGDDGHAGTYDEDLVPRVKWASYTDDAVVFEFYGYEDFAGDPPVVHADDRIVLELSDAASGGGCADTTEEAGFYNAAAFLNGTGPAGTDYADETYGFTVESDYTYVCECEDEEEARERIGPPVRTPTPAGTESPTDTPTDTPTRTPTPTERPRTPTPDGTPLLTATVDESVGGANVSANASVGKDGVSADVSVEGPGANRVDHAAVDPESPTPGDGPGFGAGAAAVALLGGALLARRR